ncbi:MAG: hypothetical protein AB7Q42_23240 [Acidimicrobiia bacterium]
MKRLAVVGAAVALSTIGATLAWAAGQPSEIDGGATAGQQAVRNLPATTSLGGCPVFPSDNPWNADVSSYPLRANSAAIMSRFNNTRLWVDFVPNSPYGVPFVIVPENQPLVPVTYDQYGHESDPGPMPIPPNAPVESNSDSHVIVLQQGTCKLYELWSAERSGGGWTAGSGAIFDLRSNALRPAGWTSADNAGLPILPGLVRCEDMAAGRITHAIRMTITSTQSGYIAPARHGYAPSTDPNLPAMGMRFRLKADYDISGFTGQAKIIMEAFKTYGLIVADNGEDWYFNGERADCFNDTELWQIRDKVPASAFEVVDTGAVTPWP